MLSLSKNHLTFTTSSLNKHLQNGNEKEGAKTEHTQPHNKTMKPKERETHVEISELQRVIRKLPLPLCPQLNLKGMTTNALFPASLQAYTTCAYLVWMWRCSLWDPSIRKIVSQYVFLPYSSRTSFIPSASLSPPFPPFFHCLKAGLLSHILAGAMLFPPSPSTVSTFCLFLRCFCFWDNPWHWQTGWGGWRVAEAFELLFCLNVNLQLFQATFPLRQTKADTQCRAGLTHLTETKRDMTQIGFFLSHVTQFLFSNLRLQQKS